MLPLYLSDRGVTASGIAFLLSLHSLVALLMGQIIGYVADLHFTRIRLLSLMTIGSALVCALFPFLPPTLPWLAAGILVLAIFFAHRVPIYMSLLLDSKNGERNFGPIRLVGSASFAIFALVVGHLADMPGNSSVVMWPSLVLFELLFLAALWKMRDVPPKVRLKKEQHMGFREAQVVLLRNPVFVWFLIFVFLCQVVSFPAHLMQIKLLREMDATALVSTASLAIAAIAEIVIFLFARQITGRIRLMPLFALVPISLTLRLFMVGMAGDTFLILLSNVLHMFNFGLLYLCSVLLVNREAPPHLRSSGQTLFTLVFANLSMLVGTAAAAGLLHLLTSGMLASMSDLIALRWSFLLACVVPLLAYLVYIPMKRAYENKHSVSGIFIRPEKIVPIDRV